MQFVTPDKILIGTVEFKDGGKEKKKRGDRVGQRGRAQRKGGARQNECQKGTPGLEKGGKEPPAL